MKIYSMTINDRKTVFFTSRKKCVNFIRETLGHEPVAACVLAKDGWNLRWLYNEELEKVNNGKWNVDLITFYGKETQIGYYAEKFHIKEIEVK